MNFLKNIFNPDKTKSGILFIVEDNLVYAKTLEAFLKSNFPDANEIKIFPVGETCLMELHKNPDVIIMDYFLNSKYYDAENGLEIIKQIRAQQPNVKIIVLSAQQEIEATVTIVKDYNCNYVKKDDTAFAKVKEIIGGQ